MLWLIAATTTASITFLVMVYRFLLPSLTLPGRCVFLLIFASLAIYEFLLYDAILPSRISYESIVAYV